MPITTRETCTPALTQAGVSRSKVGTKELMGIKSAGANPSLQGVEMILMRIQSTTRAILERWRHDKAGNLERYEEMAGVSNSSSHAHHVWTQDFLEAAVSLEKVKGYGSVVITKQYNSDDDLVILSRRVRNDDGTMTAFEIMLFDNFFEIADTYPVGDGKAKEELSRILCAME